ncbi:hypothetical protein acdb102_02090 [Acidothermaceae bacterium B102]|nr:hypothetical protein acdb102_02090 [Acidothermaceae bacterium B102]
MLGLASAFSAWAAAVALIFPGSGTSVGRVTIVPGPAVSVVVQRGADVLLPGSRKIRLAVSRDYGACESFLSASRDGRWLAWTTPAGDLRVADLRTRSAYSLGAGCDPTWGPDGRLAYLRATTVSLTQATYHSAILVRRTPLARPAVWASGQLWGLAWAGDRLVYNKTRQSYPHQELLLASGLMSAHTVPRAAVGLSWPTLVGVSPDGGRLLIQTDKGLDGSLGTFDDLVDTATGRVLSELVPRGFEALGTGVWVGDQIVAGQGVSNGGSSHPQPTLIRLSTSGDRLRVEQVRNLDPTSDGLFDWLDGLTDTGHGTIAVTHHRKTSTLLSCRVSTLTCRTVLDLG